jgi:class 3 adenylate cyclase
VPGIEDLLRRRSELLEEIDREILRSHTREVTLLFTDIVGSTRYYERMGDIAGRQMVQAHNDLLFPIVESHAGRVIKTIGDSIMASFDEPARALACTIAMQQAIARHNAAASEALRFRVRMGLHFGTAVVDERDVFGDTVNTAARVESRADGDEIIVSGAVRERADAGVPLVFLGAETVKGKERTVELYVVDWQGRGEREIVAAWKARQRPASAAAGAAGAEGGSASRGPRVVLEPVPDPRAEAASLLPPAGRGNPYLNRVMIPHPAQFVGRRALVRRIMGRLAGSRPQSLSLVGERRIGKSSLLAYLRSPVARSESLESPQSCRFAFVDFQQLRALEPDRLLSLVFDSLRRQAGMTIEGVEDFDLMRRVGEAVAAADARLVLLFDEFEAVTRNPSIGPEFYAFLRSLANGLPISFVCASGRALKDLCASREICDSPFFNIFSTMYVGLLEPADASALIVGPSAARGLPLAPLEARILAMGGRYPFFLQMACSAWYEHLEAEGLRAEDVASKPVPRAVTDIFREEAHPHFEFVLENLPEAEASGLRAAADGLGPDPEDPAAASLERKGYLAREGDALAPFSEEFARFVKGHAPGRATGLTSGT